MAIPKLHEQAYSTLLQLIYNTYPPSLLLNIVVFHTFAAYLQYVSNKLAIGEDYIPRICNLSTTHIQQTPYQRDLHFTHLQLIFNPDSTSLLLKRVALHAFASYPQYVFSKIPIEEVRISRVFNSSTARKLTFTTRERMITIPLYDEPLPRCEGPKLNRFQNKAIVKFKRLLSDKNLDGHAHVFEALIGASTFAIKIVRAYSPSNTQKPSLTDASVQIL